MISEKELSQQMDKSHPNQFFQMPVNTASAEQALVCVISADYPRLKTIFQDNPHLMFIKSIGDETIESSPLQYAIDKADSYPWKICQTICEEIRGHHPQY